MSNNLSISIVTYHSNLEFLKQTFKELSISVTKAIKQNRIKQISLTIIDNSISEEYIRSLKACLAKYWNNNYPHNIKILKQNIGYGKAHNLAMRSLTSDYHIVLNPDVLLKSDAIIQAIDYMEKNKDIGLISPHAETEQGRKLYLLKRYPDILTLFIRGFFPNTNKDWFNKRSEYYEMRDIDQNKDNKDISITSGCFMFFRTIAFQNKFQFSEKYFLYFEDFDLTWQFSSYSKIAYVPAVRIIHYGGDTARKGIKHISLFARSAITFYNRYGWKVL